jgi:hypothetical protein
VSATETTLNAGELWKLLDQMAPGFRSYCKEHGYGITLSGPNNECFCIHRADKTIVASSWFGDLTNKIEHAWEKARLEDDAESMVLRPQFV